MRVAGLIFALVITSLSLRGQDIPFNQVPPARTVPDAVVFRLLFHQAAAFQKRSDEMKAAGTPTSAFSHHLEENFGLTTEQAGALMSEAKNYTAEAASTTESIHSLRQAVTARHAQASIISAAERESFTAQARALTAKRDAITLKHMAALRSTMAPADFDRLRAIVSIMCNHGDMPALGGYIENLRKQGSVSDSTMPKASE